MPNQKKSSNGFLSLPEVQELLGIKSRKTILKYIRGGELQAYKLGGTRWRVALTDVRNYLKKFCSGTASQRRAPSSPAEALDCR